MKNQPHIPDDDLLLAATEQQTQTPIEKIESHLADCDSCQRRLLALAVDGDLRSEFVEGLRTVSSQSSGSFPSLKETFRTINTDGSNSRNGDEFDLQTVDQMLEEVLQPPTHPETLGRLGRYEVESVLGCGGMGVVMKGFDRELHRPVAIKMILPRLSKNGTAKQRFQREARAAATVLHPNVISIHDISKSNGVPWFVMPMVVGPSLKTLVEHSGPLPEREIVRIGLQIAGGLAAAHSKGLIHRDIKPENILVDNQVNRVVITDFGLARHETEEAMTQTGMVAGTLNFMSPEQSRGEEIDSRSDLFSLGSVLYFLAAGVVPFQANVPLGVLHQVGNVQHPNVQIENPEVSYSLKAIIDRLLEKSPERRFQTASELELFFNEYLAHLHQPSQNAAPTIPIKTETGKGKEVAFFKPIILALATVAVACLLGLGMWLKSSWRPTPGNLNPVESLTSTIEHHELEDSFDFHAELMTLGREVERGGKLFDESQLFDSLDNNESTEPVLNRELSGIANDVERLMNHMGEWPTTYEK